MPYAIYTATILGALSLLLMMPRQRPTPAKLGALLGAATLGGLWLGLAPTLPADYGIHGGVAAMTYYYIFAALAIGAAVRVITHRKPVYSALWFVMVVLASAGMFLLLGANFMAFAMIIIYGGAILVTYVFVLMLATQNPNETQTPGAAPQEDNLAYEPAVAVTVGFLFLAVLTTALMRPAPANPQPGLTERLSAATSIASQPADRLAAASKDPQVASAIQAVGGGKNTDLPNVQLVGLDLFRSHPLGLELAGVILLVSLVGAVVIARQKIQPD